MFWLANPNPIVDGRTKRRIDNGQRLLDAAIELLEHKPYHEISVEDICEAAGVGRATFFRTFKTKSGLMVEYNRRLADKVRHQLEVIEPADSIQALRIVGSVFADYYASTSPGMVNMAMDHMLNRDETLRKETAVELLEVLDEIVKKGFEEESIRRDLPSKLTAYLVLTHLGAAANYWFHHQERDVHRIIKDALGNWLYGAATSRD